MLFAPKPENDFAEFIRTYYEECRYRFDGIEAIAGKWTFRDLVPGLSDFDSRFIVRDGMTAADWCKMSLAVGEAHLEICKRNAYWSRNLEHTPGINLTWEELSAEVTYCSEYNQWTFYRTERPEKLYSTLNTLAHRPWDRKDEYFHLKKFCLYYGRYDREIDPGCNLFPYENRYPMHSRLMHYFAPPVQSAMCILEQRNIPGKFDAFELAQRRYANMPVWDAIREILHAGYETPEWYGEPKLTQLEDLLEAALIDIAAALREVITLVPASAGLDIRAWKRSLNEVPMDPAMLLFDSAKFARLSKGRLLFYLNAPWYFDPQWCMEGELRRMGRMFFMTPFSIYWKARTGKSISDPVAILDDLCPEPLTAEEVKAVREFAGLTSGHWEAGREREVALAIVGVYDSFLGALHKLIRETRSASQAETEGSCVPQSHTCAG